MDKWFGKVALVTGASSGIGHETALALANAGMLVVGAARRVELVEALAKQVSSGVGRIYARKCDVASEEDLLATFDWIRNELGGVDVLICNAGVFRCNFVTRELGLKIVWSSFMGRKFSSLQRVIPRIFGTRST